MQKETHICTKENLKKCFHSICVLHDRKMGQVVIELIE